jgi:hypothetical protein
MFVGVFQGEGGVSVRNLSNNIFRHAIQIVFSAGENYDFTYAYSP